MKELLIAYQGEMALKGLNRKSFEVSLVKSIKSRLERFGAWHIRCAQSAIYIEPQNEEAQQNIDAAFSALGKVFGIANISRSAVCGKDINEIQSCAAAYLAKELEGAKTFKVTAKRSDKTFALNSMEISRQAGGFLLSRFGHLSVDVHKPEVLVTVEIREKAAYVHAGKKRGAGGLPVPTSGRAAVMLSGGIDSPVAAWLMAKRGLGLIAVHFASPPYTSPRAAAKVEKLAEIVGEWAGPLPYFEVAYTKAQEYLRDNLKKQEYFTVIMRRSMLRISKMLCEREHCEAIITGESLAQVASQTLQAINCTDSAQSLPVFRPLIGMDKNDITDIARKIGSFETSILPYEDCCTIFNPPHPKTKPRIADILRLEEGLPQLAALEAEAAEIAKFRLII